jgi:hypothetical protein
MPEHQEQQAAVASLVPAPPGRLDQPLDLAPGEMLPVAVVPARFSAFASVHLFVCRVSVGVRQQFADDRMEPAK